MNARIAKLLRRQATFTGLPKRRLFSQWNALPRPSRAAAHREIFHFLRRSDVLRSPCSSPQPLPTSADTSRLSKIPVPTVRGRFNPAGKPQPKPRPLLVDRNSTPALTGRPMPPNTPSLLTVLTRLKAQK